MASLEIELKRAKELGDKKVKKFSGAVRSLENPGFDIGEEWTFPEEYTVYETHIGDNGTAQYIFVESNGNAKKFFPGTLTKSRAIANEDGTLTGERVHTTGTAAKLFQDAGTVEEGMNALKGKKVRVTDSMTIRTLRFGTTQVVNAQILNIDIVD